MSIYRREDGLSEITRELSYDLYAFYVNSYPFLEFGHISRRKKTLVYRKL